MDILASVQHLKKIQENQHFIVWRIEQTEDKKGAIVSAYKDCDSNGNYLIKDQLYTQSMDYTDFPFDQLNDFEFYQEGDVILLKQEH